MATIVWTSPRGKAEAYVELLTTAQQAEPAQAKLLTTDDVLGSPTSPDPGAPLTETLDDIEAILEADVPNNRPGYTSRFVWVNPASDRIGSMFAGVEVTAQPAAWLTEADVPPGNNFWWVQYGSAGGSGSGSVTRGGSGTASVPGGGPSGGGARHEWRCSRADIIEALPIFFTNPLGGAPGAAVVTTSISIISGNPGLSGAMNIIAGTRLRHTAGGGGPGLAGTSSGTGGAGAGGGEVGNGGAANFPGAPFDQGGTTVNSTIFNSRGGAPSNTRNTTGASGTSNYAMDGGSGGGSNGNSASIIHAGRSKRGGCGGGHGGSAFLNGGAPSRASDGGNHDVETLGAPWGGGGGPAGVGSGASGGAGPDGSIDEGGQGGGGGMGAQGDSSGTAVGGTGGPGGFPGGGSGGGGGSRSSVLSGTATSGAGFKGADACTILTITL